MKYKTHTGAVVNLIVHPVWPTPVHYMTMYWTQHDHNRIGELYRPEGYTGGIHDHKAWASFLEKKSLGDVNE